MGFASGSVTLRRYRIVGWKSRHVDEALLDQLNAHAFGRSGFDSADFVEVGWITPIHLFDVDFAAEKIAVDRFVHLRMRVDRNSPPSAILRSYLEIERLAAVEAAADGKLGKFELRQAKDAARRRAEKEAKSGAFRRISAYPLLIDPEHRMLYFGNAGAAANERLQQLFADTFGSRLEPADAAQLAARWAESAGRKRDLEDVKPSHFVDPPEDADQDATFDPADRGFLGREFLTWLWFRAATAEGNVELPNNCEAAVTIARLAHLTCDFRVSGVTAIRNDAPADSPEARAALAIGKQPTRLGLLVAAPTGEWSFTLDGGRMDVGGLTLPAGDERDPAGELADRCRQVVELSRVVDGLYQTFLQMRFSGQWSREARQMAQWAATGRLAAPQRRPQLATA